MVLLALAIAGVAEVAAYNQVFPTVKLRHGSSYYFTDTFNNGTSNEVWVSGLTVDFTEDANYNGAANPTFPWSAQIAADRTLNPGQSRLITSSTPNYHVYYHPVSRKSNKKQAPVAVTEQHDIF